MNLIYVPTKKWQSMQCRWHCRRIVDADNHNHYVGVVHRYTSAGLIHPGRGVTNPQTMWYQMDRSSRVYAAARDLIGARYRTLDELLRAADWLLRGGAPTAPEVAPQQYERDALPWDNLLEPGLIHPFVPRARIRRIEPGDFLGRIVEEDDRP